MNLATYRKAIVAFIIGVAGLFGTAMTDGNLTGTESIAALGAALVLTAGVYGFRNTPAS